jgi:hypothetical protein
MRLTLTDLEGLTSGTVVSMSANRGRVSGQASQKPEVGGTQGLMHHDYLILDDDAQPSVHRH